MLLQIFNVLGPVIIITLIGYILGRSKLGIHSSTISVVTILVATPALIFAKLTEAHIDKEVLGIMTAAAVLCVVISGVIGVIFLKLFKGSVSTFLPSLIMPNSGNVGLPLVLLTFGEENLHLGVCYFFVIALLQHSVGASIAAGSYQLSFVLRQPLIYAVICVIAVVALDADVPQVVLSTAEMLGGMMIPAMLILLGISLATLEVSDLKPALGVAFGRLGLGLISGFAVINILGLEGAAAGTVFLLAAMPVAVVNYIYAEHFSDRPAQVAGGIVVSTIVTFAFLPAIIWVALRMTE